MRLCMPADPEMDEMILTHLEASGHHEAAAAFRKSARLGPGAPLAPAAATGPCPPTLDHYNGDKHMHNAIVTASGGHCVHCVHCAPRPHPTPSGGCPVLQAGR